MKQVVDSLLASDVFSDLQIHTFVQHNFLGIHDGGTASSGKCTFARLGGNWRNFGQKNKTKTMHNTLLGNPYWKP